MTNYNFDDEFDFYDAEGERIGFADPGGNSALACCNCKQST